MTKGKHKEHETSDVDMKVDAESSARSERGSPKGSKRLRQRMNRKISFKGVPEEVSVKLKKKACFPILLPREELMYRETGSPGTPLDEIDLSESSFFQHSDGAAPRTWASWVFGRKLGDIAELWASVPNPYDVRELVSNLTVIENARKALESRDFTVGDELAAVYDLRKEHPVILIPGIVSTGLESWSTESVARGFFRKRLWVSLSLIFAVVSNKERWLQALSIDPETGLDPPGYKVRAAQGLDAASEFIQGYWIWQKIVENLATLGYDTNSMDMAAYDWRLAYYNLEIRDSFFSRLKSKIELYKRHSGKKVVLCSHSMGGTVVLVGCLKWVEAQPDKHGFGGGAGPKWVEEHIEAWANVAGTLLGVSKAMTAFLSGEMRDTVELHPAGSWVLEKFFSRKERAKLFRRWPGSSSMWVKGGNRIWGTNESAPDDPENATDTHGRFLSFRHPEVPPDEHHLDRGTVWPNLTIEEASAYVLMHTPATFQRMMESNYSYGFETNEARLKANDEDHRKWSNPLEVRLPDAPSMKIYCLYGHGKQTERSYWYMQGDYEYDDTRSDAENSDAMCDASDPSNSCDNASTTGSTVNFPMARKNWIDAAVNVKGSRPEVRSGVKFGDGDGTISVLSLGSMCVKGWKGKTKWNPSGIEVITQEYRHSPQTLDLRGGALTADHVDILGSSPLNRAVLQIAAGRGDLVRERIESDIMAYVAKMDWE
ncbi:hypothetical protein TREMEDRAFT_68093 [Tremella mesenterica DSM 1558]|uniref:uncharacterized protein n=1 Tax=Tremella mesenterica (strain ATCC 24925 / CBS 8224 / DSM 1558 / NBRC 9311 / NRRL Y-6157 / RJB 2259-6 / UBC 559-6) TaxID=578456 RepID=UPI0003F4A3E8|nr:uncharacterized protein TREMEDRAFT_68093 [Tremella mesenterica DSM 1558]EIW70499.1 hypothetical protein TREMEDRAFT_68093 [Tremella mesenterica DSM 1558]